MKFILTTTFLCFVVAIGQVTAQELLSNVINRSEKEPAYLDTFLNKEGVDVSATDSHGWSLILWAAQSGKTEMVHKLVKRGADVNQVSKEQYKVTPLVCASDRGWPDTTQALIDLGAKVKGDAGARSVKCASSYDTDNHAKVILVLAKAGAELNGELVWESLEYKRYKCLEALLQGGANVNQRSQNEMTPLIHAVSLDIDPKLVRIILKYKPDLNTKAKFPFVSSGLTDIPIEERYFDRTALMCAVQMGRLDMVKLLIEAGADPMIQDRHGETAIDLAKQAGKTNVVEYLQNKTSIGIGSPIAEAPSLTTGHTDRVSGDSAEFKQSLSEKQQAE